MDGALYSWFQSRGLIDRFRADLPKFLDAYRQEEPEDFYEVFGADCPDVSLKYLKLSYELPLDYVEDPKYSITGDMIFHERVIGWFRQGWLGDGTYFDDWFVIE
ncbi:hypothetical protein GAG84_27330 [Bacteroides thetaiotaomicron]|nr:hypothetical protein GAG84_27330 [Bacteroides thetaiotaomicron]